MQCLRTFLIGLALWSLPSLIDLEMGGYGFAATTWMFWLVAGPLGAWLLFREGRSANKFVAASIAAGFGIACAVLAMSVLYARWRDDPESLGGGIQGFSTESEVALFVALALIGSMVCALPTGVGVIVRRERDRTGPAGGHGSPLQRS